MLDPILPEAIRPQVDRILDSLVSEGLLLCVDYNPPCYAFPSPAICTILQGVMPPSECIQFHQTLAQFIEKRYADSIASYYRRYVNGVDCVVCIGVLCVCVCYIVMIHSLYRVHYIHYILLYIYFICHVIVYYNVV